MVLKFTISEIPLMARWPTLSLSEDEMELSILVKSAIDSWKQSDKSDEWYFSNLRDDILSKCDCESAFSGINELMPLLLNEPDDFLYSEIIEIIISLARKSQTTEIPSELSRNFRTIKERLKSQGDNAMSKLDDLASYYQIEI